MLLQPPPLIDEQAERLFMENDQAFHEALAHATHNPFFVLLIESIRAWMLELRRRAAQVVRRAPSITKHHWEIFEQVKAGNVAGAQQAMSVHLDEAERIQYAALQMNTQRATLSPTPP
jgi:DNA-binding FadR family transcriptional regulator